AGREASVAVRAAPVELGGALRDALFERVDTTVLTSATLATRDGFDFVRARLGLASGAPAVESVYDSPFCFETQTMVAIPDDLPLPDERGPTFDDATSRVAVELAELSDGGVFVLFTSYRALRAVATELRRRRVDTRWPLMVQGEGSRAALLERFTGAGNAFLLGVASFWEGVDVPGEPLRALLIPKLPFRVPTEPLTAARTELIEQHGGSGFRDYLLPHAALRLKQGFGRLIRTRTDRGAAVLLDRRVLQRGYGRYLLGSLPATPLRVGPWSGLRDALRDFYGGGGSRDTPSASPPLAESVPVA
ncbi:MAG: ATP-dependent DNA helicase, partial [Longimicrobiales bacterium]